MNVPHSRTHVHEYHRQQLTKRITSFLYYNFWTVELHNLDSQKAAINIPVRKGGLGGGGEEITLTAKMEPLNHKFINYAESLQLNSLLLNPTLLLPSTFLVQVLEICLALKNTTRRCQTFSLK